MKQMHELDKLKSACDDELWDILECNNAFIAGGAITSVMTNKPINDIDVYFRNPTDFTRTVLDVFGVSPDSLYSSQNSVWAFNITDKSIMLKSGDKLVQFIMYKYFPDPYALFESYDFTINMGAYDMKKEDWVFHQDFFRHNAQRYLEFNPNTDYPIVSALRVQKYKERGYGISKAQMLKILMTVSDLQIYSWTEFKDHVGGMYGLVVEDIFDTTQPFSKMEAVLQLDSITIPEHVTTESMSFDNVVEKLTNKLDLRLLQETCAEFKAQHRFVPNWNRHLPPKFQTT